VRVESCHKHERFIEKLFDSILISYNSHDAVYVEGVKSISHDSNRMEKIPCDDRFEDIELKVTIGASNCGSNMIAHNLSRDHSHCFALCRVNFAWHDGGAWLVLRKRELTKTTSWSRSEEPDVVSNLHHRSGKSINGATEEDKGVFSSEKLEFIFSSLEWKSSFLRNVVGYLFLETNIGVEASAYSSATLSEFVNSFESLLNSLDIAIAHGNIS
jgi:hypothetical protein